MPLGPVELVVVQLPGNEVKGDIVPAIKELVELGTVRVIDIIFLMKDESGHVKQLEINELDDAAQVYLEQQRSLGRPLRYLKE